MNHWSDLTLVELAEAIRSHAIAQHTGTFIISTKGSIAGKIVLKQGTIIALSYQANREASAIEQLRTISLCDLEFTTELLLAAKQLLPSTDELLAYLIGSSTNPITNKINTAPANNNQHGMSLKKVRAILTEEAMDILGPFAIPLCNDYLRGVSDPPKRKEVMRVLSMLSRDIKDPASFHQLEQLVIKKVLV